MRRRDHDATLGGGRNALMIAAAVTLSGCAASLTVPAEYQGTVPVKLTTETSLDSVCSFAMAPEGRAVEGQWLGFVGLARGKSIDFKLKPGVYRVRTSSCQGGWTAEDGLVRIEGPTQIAVGYGDPPPTGFRQVNIAVVENQAPPPGQYSSADDTTAAADQGSEDSAAPEQTTETAPSESSEPAPEPAAPSCQPNGAAVLGSGECCSMKTYRGKDQNGSVSWICCESGPDCT